MKKHTKSTVSTMMKIITKLIIKLTSEKLMMKLSVLTSKNYLVMSWTFTKLQQ